MISDNLRLLVRYQDSKIGLNPHGSSIATRQFFSGIIFAKVTKNNVELIDGRPVIHQSEADPTLSERRRAIWRGAPDGWGQ
jgi:hypothetical protein